MPFYGSLKQSQISITILKICQKSDGYNLYDTYEKESVPLLRSNINIFTIL